MSLQISSPSPVHFPSPTLFEIFKPGDAARELGVNEDTVTYHLAKRPRLFPVKEGRNHEWTRAEFEQVKRVLRTICPKASAKARLH